MVVCFSMNIDIIATTPKPPKLNPKQLNFIQLYYLDKETSGNVYQSALKAGFSRSYARVMTTNARSQIWLQEAKKYMTQMDIGLIRFRLEQEALNAISSRDRIAALTTLGKWTGLDQSTKTEVNVIFSNSVPRPIIDITEVEG